MRFPDFLIVGAARSGTTAVHRMLGQHPQVFLPSVKEPCFFAFAGNDKEYRGGKFSFAIRDSNDYSRLFSSAMPGQQTGEASTPYLFLYKESIANIRRFVPSPHRIRIVILLRHPVERAHSNYLWRVRDGRETVSFEQALAMEEQRVREGYSFDYFYTRRSFYFDAVKAYLDAFPEVHIILYDDLKSKREQTMKGLCDFLGIDSEFRFEDILDVNHSYRPKSVWLTRLVTYESSWKFRLLRLLPEGWVDRMRSALYAVNGKKQAGVGIAPETRKRLLALFREDTERLAELTGRDLSAWYD